MRSLSNKTNGFTIVELLVVIVVIAILASVTIVTYNGARARAEKVKTITTVRAFEQALELYRINENHYPLAGWFAGASFSSCLGSGYSEHQNLNGVNLPDCRWGSWGETNPLEDFNTELAKYGQVSAAITYKVEGWDDDGMVGMYYGYYPNATLDGQPQRDWLVYAVPDKSCGMTVPAIPPGQWPTYVSKNDDHTSEDFGNGGLCHVPLP